jgi:6-phosphogluconolactonase
MQSNRRQCIRYAAAGLLGMALLPSATAGKNSSKDGKYFVYVGTYTRGDSKGVYAYRFDAKSGNLEKLGLAGEVVNPSWVTVHPNGKFLYAVSELGNDGKSSGMVTAFAIDPKTAMLTKLNSVSSGGGGACHLAVDKTGKSLMVANYGTGSVAAIAIQADGRLAEKPVIVQHSGSSVNQSRQRGPHAHAVVLSADNRFLFVPDLGADKVFSYRLNPSEASIAANDPPSATITPGSGPRHFAFHPKNKYAYGLNEMKSSVTAFEYDSAKGALKEIQTISTLPKDFTGEDNSAEIEVDAKGRFVYASNRGHDSIAVFAIGKDGKLALVENVSTKGKAPRNFRIDPTGAFLLAANQNTGNIVVFRIDQKSGRLTDTGKSVEAPFPVCLQFIPAS